MGNRLLDGPFGSCLLPIVWCFDDRISHEEPGFTFDAGGITAYHQLYSIDLGVVHVWRQMRHP